MLFDPSQDPLALWLYAERSLSVGTRTYSPFAGISEMAVAYRPDSATRSFVVPTVWIEASQQAKFIYESHRLPVDLVKLYSPEPGRFLLPIHPATIPILPLEVRAQIEELAAGPSLEVSPTASTRTVYVHGVAGSREGPQHFLKLHFPARISRFDRPMTREDVVYQLWISRQIQRARLPHFPDLGGGYALFHGDLSVGFLVRPTWPECGLKDAVFTLPGFSLYGGDRLAPNDPPLLAQLPQHFREAAIDFIISRIVAPTIKLWVRAVRELGIIPELHGQNTLLCFDRLASASSICFRDSDVFMDCRIRQHLGLDHSDLEVDAIDDYALVNSEQALSLSYDGFLVHHFLAKVAAFAEEWLGIESCTVRDAARYVFRTAGGDALSMSAKAYYYDDHLRHGEQYLLTEQPSFELWR